MQTAGSFRSNALLFADDSSIHSRMISDLRRLLRACEEWSQEVDMVFAPEKSIYVGPCTKEEMRLELYGRPISKMDKAKYLGIWMDQFGIDWESVIQERSGKAMKTLGVMSQLGLNATGWATSASINVYKTFIRPQMEYGLALRPLDASTLAPLEKVQKMGMRKILGAPNNASIGSMQKLLQLEPMQHRNRVLNVQQSARLHNSSDSSRPPVVIWWGMLQYARGSRLSPLADSLTLSSIKKNPLWSRIRKRDHLFLRLAPPTRITISEERAWTAKIWIKGQKQKEKYRAIMDASAGSIADSLVLTLTDKVRPHLTPECSRRERVTLNRWLTGLVCQHQKCCLCDEPLTRLHGIVCSGADAFLRENLDISQSLLLEIPTLPLLHYYRLLQCGWKYV